MMVKRTIIIKVVTARRSKRRVMMVYNRVDGRAKLTVHIVVDAIKKMIPQLLQVLIVVVIVL
jgi:hypothetical protein